MEDDKKIPALYITSIILIILGSLIGVISLILFLSKNGSVAFSLPIDSNKFSQFGDLFGGVIGSLWALSGVLLFYLALRLQTKEFKLQRDELKETRKVFSEQSKLIKIEQFENRLFNLLQLLEASINSSKASLSINGNKTEVFGRSIFEELSYDIAEKYHEEIEANTISLDSSYILFNQIYGKVYYENMSLIEHYINQITQIFKVVGNHSVQNDSTNIDYFSYIISHLSKYELLIISYHGIFKKKSSLYLMLNEYTINSELLIDMDYSRNESEYIPDIIDIQILLDSYKLRIPDNDWI